LLALQVIGYHQLKKCPYTHLTMNPAKKQLDMGVKISLILHMVVKPQSVVDRFFR